MNWIRVLSVSVMMALGVALLPASTVAQQKTLRDQLVGVWTLVSIDNVLPDGKKQQLWGANPKGILILDAGGRFAQTQMRADIPKFTSNDRYKATPEENSVAMQGSLAGFGTWSVNEAEKTLVLHREGSLLPNDAGTDSKRVIVSLTADELKATNPGPATGGRNEVVYRRAK
jgi:hypothetical protein